MNQTIVGAHIGPVYTFRKGRLDMQLTKGTNSYSLSWEKQGRDALLTFSKYPTLPKKRVNLFRYLGDDIVITGIEVHGADRILKINLSNNIQLILGFYPALQNIYYYEKDQLVDSFFKNQIEPFISKYWLNPDSPLPGNIPGQQFQLEDLYLAELGIDIDPESDQVIFGDTSKFAITSIADFIPVVLKSVSGPKSAPLISIHKTAETVLKRWKSKLEKMRQELESANNWPELELKMQSLQIAQGLRIPIVNGILTIESEYSPIGTKLEYNVDSEVSLSQAIETTAKNIRKQKAQIDQLKGILPFIEKDIQKLLALLEKDDPENLLHFLQENGETLDKTGKRETLRKPYKKYMSPSGFDILVGRDSRDNDVLTFKIANKNDWWFHARQISGSHVILRTGNKAPLPIDIQKAAQHAALNSKAKHSGIAVVQYCQRKHLSKPKGSSPGQVLIHQENTITIDLDAIDGA
ncbi:MAG: NFACT RNA binding domain-containing protein [Candidatus Marinimicrobia bacterium]|nr:NFACT RNA binding domain-containing protein [Candidatus Neomarinimicrobiota bacterium]